MTTSNTQTDPILITFPPSLDSELARFLLSHYGVRHLEQRHTFIFSLFATLWHAQTVIFPVLYSDKFKLVGPRPISEYFDSRCGPTLQLWPSLEDQKRQTEADWNQFNDTLAFASAKFAYFYLLPHRDLMIAPLTQGTPDFEVNAVKRAYSVFAGLLSTALGLSQKKADESLAQIRTVFVSVDARLADGRKFLVGDRLSISDLAFAVAAAPLLLPSGYGGPIPSYDHMPAAVRSAVNEMRTHPAGAYALRIYKEYR